MPYDDWLLGEPYDDQPPSCNHYVMEWKLTFNKRVAAKFCILLLSGEDIRLNEAQAITPTTPYKHLGIPIGYNNTNQLA